MEKITTDISTFENMRKSGYVYVDKTDLLWRLAADTEGRQFFISRPRRFGKSLMLSTLRCIFEGKRELFKGLKIDKLKYDWKQYPVVMLNMADAVAPTVDKLRENLSDMVDGLVEEFGLGRIRKVSEPGKSLGNFFKSLAAKQGEFVVLVDEYDVPLQGFLGDRKALLAVRKMMHDFYIQLKNNEKNIRFLMLTGVTKLTKVSVFSGLNHLSDLTMKRKEYAALLGYTPKEIADCFPKRLDALAKRNKTDRKGALKLILDWYDSYRFSHLSAARVCNPISVGQALVAGDLQGYWVATAVSTLVMERIAAAGKTPADFEGCTATVDELDLCEATELPAKSLMYQSGYLTIKSLSKTEVDEIGKPKLVLGAPNHEVRGAIRAGWFNSFLHVPASEFDALVDVAKRQVAAGDLRGLVGESLYRIYAKIPPEWRIRSEADVKRHFRLFMEMLGAKVAAEEGSAFGYADAIIETKKFVWVFEFKFNKSAKAAVRQIREKGYADAYRGDKRPVTLVGVNFRTAKRNIDEPVFWSGEGRGKSGELRAGSEELRAKSEERRAGRRFERSMSMNMKMKMMVAAVGMAAALTGSAVTEAIAYQGRIQRTDGKPFQAVQSMSMTFQVCDTNAADTILWSRIIPVRVGTDGSFYVELSDQNGTADPSVPKQVPLARACGNASGVQIRLKLPDSSANTKAFRETLKTYSHVDHALFVRQTDEATVNTLKSESVIVRGDLKVSGNLIVPDSATFSKVMALNVAKDRTAEFSGGTVSSTIAGWTQQEGGMDDLERDRIVTVVRKDGVEVLVFRSKLNGEVSLRQDVSIPVCLFGKRGQAIGVPSGAEIKKVQSLK